MSQTSPAVAAVPEALAQARALLESGRYAAAAELLQGVREDHPQALEAARLLFRAASGAVDWMLAEAAARKAVAASGGAAQDLAELGAALQKRHKDEEALACLAEARRGPLDQPALVAALHATVYAASALGRWGLAEEALRELIGIEPQAAFHSELAETLYHQGRADDARAAAETAIGIDPAQTRARAVLSLLKYSRAKLLPRHDIVTWPARLSAYRDAEAVIRSSLLRGHPDGEPFIRPGARFVTLGSCFAENLAVHLRLNGFEVHSEVIGEQVNSTYANRYFLEWVEDGAASAATQAMEDAFGAAMRERYRTALAQCDAFVFTLGVAPCFFDAETGEYVFANTAHVSHRALMERAEFKMTTVQENVENIGRILASVNRLSAKAPHVVLTVSPVPLAATVNAPSAVIADCLSKSTLRLACDAAIAKEPPGRLHYWPSFEMIRWLGPYYDKETPPVFGAEDGKARHVSNWIVRIATELFLETYAA